MPIYIKCQVVTNYYMQFELLYSFQKPYFSTKNRPLKIVFKPFLFLINIVCCLKNGYIFNT